MPDGRDWGRGPPPWWPQGTPWRGRNGPWRHARRSFIWRIGCLFFALLALMLAFSVIGFLFGHAGGGEDWRGNWQGPPIFGILLLGGGVFLVLRLLKRTAQPVSDLMEATGRLAEGDYTVRVRPYGSPEVRDLALAFNALAERLERDESQRRTLIADVTHELRTPLSVIRGAAEGIADGVYPGDAAHVTPIVSGVEVIARLVDDLATLSSAEAGQLALHREEIAPRELVEGAVSQLRPAFEAADVALRNDVQEDLAVLDVDVFRMRQVLANVLTNALHHTPDGGSVIVAAARTANEVTLRITDTGAGIPADQLPHIFERFSKAPDSQGSGLGLAIARSIVQAHGGSITAESEAGTGTTIAITLPVSRD
jgi:signal transduction histidine kinase